MAGLAVRPKGGCSPSIAGAPARKPLSDRVMLLPLDWRSGMTANQCTTSMSVMRPSCNWILRAAREPSAG
jgi:hypothetical protein